VRVVTRDKRLKAAIEGEKDCRRKFSVDMCKKIALRIAALTAAISLADFWPPNSGPERCHELKGDRAGVFSMDVKQPHRLLFRPVDEPLPKDDTDERARWNGIKAVELLTIEDTHG